MRLKGILFFLFLSAFIPLAYAADFGEDDQYLGQVVDDYENADNIAAMIGTINNETLDCMELFFIGDAGFENLSTYTEVDGSDNLTVFDDRVEWSTMRRDAVAWVVYDFGVDYFTDFQINFTLDFSDIEAGDVSIRDINTVILLSDIAGTFADTVGDDSLCVMPRQDGIIDDRYIYQIKQIEDGVIDEEMGVVLHFMDRHYCTFERLGTTMDIRVYNDLARTVLIDSLTHIGSDGGYRYLAAVTSYETVAGDPADHSSGLVANITLCGADYGTGTYYTVNVLEGDPARVIFYNATIPSGTGMTMEFSTDNVTWVDHNNQAGFDILIAGYEALDLRDIYNGTTYRRVNQTSDGTDTPRMYQEGFVTVTAQPTAEGGLFPGLAIGISLLIIGAAYLVENRR